MTHRIVMSSGLYKWITKFLGLRQLLLEFPVHPSPDLVQSVVLSRPSSVLCWPAGGPAIISCMHQPFFHRSHPGRKWFGHHRCFRGCSQCHLLQLCWQAIPAWPRCSVFACCLERVCYLCYTYVALSYLNLLCCWWLIWTEHFAIRGFYISPFILRVKKKQTTHCTRKYLHLFFFHKWKCSDYLCIIKSE